MNISTKNYQSILLNIMKPKFVNQTKYAKNYSTSVISISLCRFYSSGESFNGVKQYKALLVFALKLCYLNCYRPGWNHPSQFKLYFSGAEKDSNLD